MLSQIPCFVISLMDSSDRKDWFSLQSERLGIRFEFVPAVDGSRLPAKVIDEMRARGTPGNNKTGPRAIGCYLSHRNIWQEWANSQSKWCFVAEDDLHLSVESPLFLRSDNWVPSGVDIIKAESYMVSPHGYRYRGVMVSKRTLSVPGNYNLRRLRSTHYGAAGYFLSNVAARRLVELTHRICDPVDDILFTPLLSVLRDFRVYQMDPAIGIQDSVLSRVDPTAPVKFFSSSLQVERDAAVDHSKSDHKYNGEHRDAGAISVVRRKSAKLNRSVRRLLVKPTQICKPIDYADINADL